MTLDEAIRRYEEIADYHKGVAEAPCESIHQYFANNVCYHAICEKEHRQFARWLKELKKYREEYPFGTKHQTEPSKCDTCETYWNCQGQCDEMPQIEDEQTEPSTEATTGLPGPCIGCLKECEGCDFQNSKEAWERSQVDCQW